MHDLFQSLSYVLNKNVAMQLVMGQNAVVSAFLRHPRHARRGQSSRNLVRDIFRVCSKR